MKNELIFRPLNKEDYEIICEWWRWWKWPVLPKDFLPNNAEGGFMVEKDNIPIVSGFLYLTNSKVAMLEWIVSNPKYKEKDRKQAIEKLLIDVEDFCKSINIKYIFSIGRNKHLMNTHEKLGWHVDEKPSYEIIKNI